MLRPSFKLFGLACAVFSMAASMPEHVRSEGIPDRDLILACLTENAGVPGQCSEVIFAPCSYRQQQGLARACAYRLRQQWDWVLEDEIAEHRAGLASTADQEAFDNAAAQRIGARDIACPLPRDDPATASLRRNQCRILDIVGQWHGLQQ